MGAACAGVGAGHCRLACPPLYGAVSSRKERTACSCARNRNPPSPVFASGQKKKEEEETNASRTALGRAYSSRSRWRQLLFYSCRALTLVVLIIRAMLSGASFDALALPEAQRLPWSGAGRFLEKGAPA